METELPTNLLHLPVELRLNIFEQLGFEELIHACKALPEDRNLIEIVFRNMFKDHKLQILYVGTPKENEEIHIRYEQMNIVDISAKNANETLKKLSVFFQCFGHCINKLVITYNSFEVRTLVEPLQRLIKKYVADSVNEVHLSYRYRYSELADSIIQFPNAKVVEIEDGQIDAATLHQMFATVRNLNLRSVEMLESLSHFRHLKSLTTPKKWEALTFLPLFKKTLKMNPQIKCLSIRECSSWDFMKMLNEIRPDIESLEFFNILVRGDEINSAEPLRFANLKVFKCTSFDGQRQEIITQIPFEFGNLDEIQFAGNKFINSWVDIVMQNKKLRKIRVLNALRREHLERIADGLPNLEEIVMSYPYNDFKSVPDIVDLLQRAKQLKRAQFLYFGMDKCNEAAKQLKNEWKTIVDDEDEGLCCFVRK